MPGEFLFIQIEWQFPEMLQDFRDVNLEPVKSLADNLCQEEIHLLAFIIVHIIFLLNGALWVAF